MDGVTPTFGLGFIGQLPLELDHGSEYVLVRRYAEVPSAEPDGWIAAIFLPARKDARDTRKFEAVDEAIRWARASGVRQILVEDIEDGRVRLLRGTGSE